MFRQRQKRRNAKSLKSLLPSIWSEDEKGGDLFTSLQKEIDRVFDSFKTMSPGSVGAGALTTRMDVSESEKDIRITAELPGVKPEDLNVELVDDVLRLCRRITAPSRLSLRPPAALRKGLNSLTIRPFARLAGERKSGAIS